MKETIYDLKYTSSSVRHDGGFAWASIFASGTGSFIFIDDENHDSDRRMNSKIYREMFPK